MRFPYAATGAWTLVLVLGLGATAWQLAGEGRERTPAASAHASDAGKSGPQRMFAWEPTEATLVRVGSADRVREFRRSGASAWEEVGEGGAPFDVDAYIGLFSQARIDRVLASGSGDDKQMGLDAPALRVVVQASAGKVLADVECGASTPDGFGRYVRVRGRDGVAIVPGYQFAGALEAMGVADRRARIGGPREPDRTTR